MTGIARFGTGLVVAAIVCAPLGSVWAQSDAEVKASRKCRQAIASTAAKLVKTALKAIDTCHINRNKKKPVGNCNLLSEADVKGKFEATRLKSITALDKKCPLGERVRANYPNGDIVGTLAPIIRSAVESSAVALQGALDLGGDKAKVNCHKAISKARTGIVNEIEQGAVKCQKAKDKTANVFDDLDASCLVQPLKSRPKADAAIAKACASVANNGTVLIGSCDRVQAGCVQESATATGQLLAAAIYRVPYCGDGVVDASESEQCDDANRTDGDGCDGNCTTTGCGNGVRTGAEQCDDGNPNGADGCTVSCTICGNGQTTPPEQCDDGNLTSGDGCDANCTAPVCGNGVIAPPEECDDGNELTTDDCVLCKHAICGDGFIQTGVELCGDGLGPFCLNPTEKACFDVGLADCNSAGTTRLVSVSFSAPEDIVLGGLQIALDYPEGKLGVPGNKDVVNNARITVIPAGLGPRRDFDYEVQVNLLSFDVIPPGPFYTVEFDECVDAEPATPNEFACLLRGASDVSGNAIVGDDLKKIQCLVSFPPS